MRPLLFLFLIFSSCAPKEFYLTEAQVNDTINTHEPMPVLAAYRKYPGAPKTVEVKGYYRNDSTYVAGHKRSRRE